MSKTIGLHGRTLLGLLYRHGALTRPQMVRLTGLHESAIDRQLRHLRNAGYVDRIRDVAAWKQTNENARTGYYLTVPAGAKTAAFFEGIENDVLSLKHYRRVRLPGTVSHRLLGNEYLIRLSEAAEDEGLEVGEVFAESSPDFPLFGSAVPKTSRADTGYRFARLVPDATWTLDGTRYYLEVETGTVARRELVSKIADYAGRWRRILKPNLGERKFHNPHAKIESLIILTPTNEHKRMRDYLIEHLPDAEDWRDADAAIRAAAPEKDENGEIKRYKSGAIKALAHPLQLILVAGIEDVRDDPLGRHYSPLRKYPPEHSDPAGDGTPGWRVSLADAAEISSRIPVPAKPPKLATGEEETLQEERERGGVENGSKKVRPARTRGTRQPPRESLG